MLSEKQKRFCKEYIIDCNATQAAIRAGYSEQTAAQTAARLLKNVKVSASIAECMAEKNAELIATADEVLSTLTRVLRRQEHEHVVVTLKERVPLEGGGNKVRYVERETTQVVEIPPRLCDVNRAAELLGKRFALWTEKVDVGGELVRIVDDVPMEAAPDG